MRISTTSTLVVRGVAPDPQTPDLPDNGVMMVNPRNITVVFSPQLSVQGRPYSANVVYEKFDHRMRPIRMRITLSMKAFYVGPVGKDFGFAQTQDVGRVQAVVPYDESIKVQAEKEAVKFAKLDAPALASFNPKTGGFGNPWNVPQPSGDIKATGAGLITAAKQFLGEPYSTASGRTDVNSGHKDCSGLIVAAYKVATGDALGANVSSTIYDLGVKSGLAISREMAFGIAGACLLMPEDPYQGAGPAGHIGFSDGQGGTVEATPPRVQELSNTYQSWGSNSLLASWD